MRYPPQIKLFSYTNLNNLRTTWSFWCKHFLHSGN